MLKKLITAGLVAMVGTSAMAYTSYDVYELRTEHRGQSEEYINYYKDLGSCEKAGKEDFRGGPTDTLKVHYRYSNGDSRHYDVQKFFLWSGGYNHKGSFSCTKSHRLKP